MARRRKDSLEERLAALKALADEDDLDVLRRELRRSLRDPRAPVIARAARLAGERGETELAGDMAAAFERCLEDPVQNDKGCVAKTAIARTLLDLEEPRRELFLAGSRHVQKEGAWGPPVDTAVELRGICAHGLVASSHPEAMLEIVRLLADPEWRVRAEAARAASGASRLEAEPVLRLKALLGDKEPDVTSECLGALLHLSAESSLDFVGGFLESDEPSIAQAAALALGESRLERAIDPLRASYGLCRDDDVRRTLLLALAMTRREPALELLLDLLVKVSESRAGEVLAALALHRHDDRVRDRVEEALDLRKAGRELWAVHRREFLPD